MKTLSQQAASILREMCKDIAIHASKTINNSGVYMAAHVEVIGALADGRRLISVAHYGKQNGDMMRDPEMIFIEMISGDAIYYTPYYFRNDYMGIEENSVDIEGGAIKTFKPKLQADHAKFASQWMRNIKDQQGL